MIYFEESADTTHSKANGKSTSQRIRIKLRSIVSRFLDLFHTRVISFVEIEKEGGRRIAND